MAKGQCLSHSQLWSCWLCRWQPLFRCCEGLCLILPEGFPSLKKYSWQTWLWALPVSNHAGCFQLVKNSTCMFFSRLALNCFPNSTLFRSWSGMLATSGGPAEGTAAAGTRAVNGWWRWLAWSGGDDWHGQVELLPAANSVPAVRPGSL